MYKSSDSMSSFTQTPHRFRAHTSALVQTSGEVFGSSPAVKMWTFFLLVLNAALCCVTSDTNLETLMDNVIVLRVPYGVGTAVNVPLTCGETYDDQPVFWKKNGVELTPPLRGNKVEVLVEEMDGGNYTCHLGPDGGYLNHTLILIQLDPDNRTVILEEKSPEEGHIHCSAHNYRGSFHCSWRRTSSRSSATVLLVKAERHLEKIPCELDADGSGVHCHDDACLYNEEQHQVSITVYIYSYSRLEAYTKTFYLREIVRPERLPNLSISEGKVFTWSYPESWDKPCSFFRLQFEVKVVPHGHSCDSNRHLMHNTTDETKHEVNVENKKYVFCVRAQDKYTSGPFNHWGHCTVNKHMVSC